MCVVNEKNTYLYYCLSNTETSIATIETQFHSIFIIMPSTRNSPAKTPRVTTLHPHRPKTNVRHRVSSYILSRYSQKRHFPFSIPQKYRKSLVIVESHCSSLGNGQENQKKVFSQQQYSRHTSVYSSSRNRLRRTILRSENQPQLQIVKCKVLHEQGGVLIIIMKSE